jgi:hypothetical protein
MAVNDGKRRSIGPSAISDGCQVKVTSKQPSAFNLWPISRQSVDVKIGPRWHVKPKSNIDLIA